jgi:ATP-dependent DNA ligase
MKIAPPSVLLPMEAESVDEIPTGPGWQYEPKWDGFRCLVIRDGENVELQSKSGKPLGRYFPEIEAAVRAVDAKRFILDGEIAVPVRGHFQFDELLQRIHPAESRIRKLAAEHPAVLIVFDLLADGKVKELLRRPLIERRRRLESFAKRYLRANKSIRLSPATTSLSVAQRWFRGAGGNLDGIIAKRLDSPYRPGERTPAVLKIKPAKTADCVVGGFRYLSRNEHVVGSLLLGLYDDDGLLHHVGFTSSLKAAERVRLTAQLEKLRKPPGFTGKAPGGPSRWSTKRSSEWEPLAPKLVVEVGYDQFSAGRFRHGTALMRWRPDKAPRQCTMAQVQRRGGADVRLLGM